MSLLLPGCCVKQTDGSRGLSKNLSLKQVPAQGFGHFAGVSLGDPEPVLASNQFLLALSPPVTAPHPLLFGGPFPLPRGCFAGVGASGLDDTGALLALGLFWSILLPRMAPRRSHVSGPRAALDVAAVSRRDPPVGRQSVPSAAPRGRRGTSGTARKSLTSLVTPLIKRDHGKRGKVGRVGRACILPRAPPPPAHATRQLCSRVWFER